MRPHYLLALAATAGCATIVDPPPHPGRIPVVEALLVGGTDSTRFRIIWADPEATAPVEPIAPSEIRLALSTGASPGRALVPDPDSAGRFVAHLAIIPGNRYQLEGTIGEHSIAAATTIPSGFVVEDPAGDVTAGPPGIVVPFRWRASGATVFAADFAVFGAFQYHHTRDTVGSLLIIAPDPHRSPALTLWAMNADAERYLYHVATPFGNVTGGLGMLGGAVTARKAFRWP